MSLDFIGFIVANATSLDTEQKQAMLDDFVEHFNYSEALHGDKKEFANARYEEFTKNAVKSTRESRAERAIVVEDLEI